ncbi:MAG: phosphatase PAP2 family protein [Bacteroidales bacterium]|nr:phosphatase PAP2 family protein [Bacteroidales bacterium]
MKDTLFLFLLLAVTLSVRSQEPLPLLTPQQMPNPVRFLPPPPDTLSDAFAYDQSQYRWGKEQRLDSARLAIAVRDADWSIDCICREFSEPFGMTISKEATPAIFRMLYVGLITADMVGKLPKDFYKRTRPYVYYGEPTIYPQDEDELRYNGSYPSGHTIEGWCAALLLTELNPDRADTILARGFMYGQSRVIAGYHWQSDVDAGRLAASAAIARLHADKRFMRLLRKAHREYRCLSRKKR